MECMILTVLFGFRHKKINNNESESICEIRHSFRNSMKFGQIQ